MVVEFLFNEVTEKSKLYTEHEFRGPTPFSDDDTYTLTRYVEDEYCAQSITSLAEKLPEINTIQNLSDPNKIGNEVFHIESDAGNYTVCCTISSHDKEKANMLVRIESEDNCDSSDTGAKQYDDFFEKLKFSVKEIFRHDWENCIWIKDEQAEELASMLYPKIFRAENLMRAFANKVLVSHLGVNWLNCPGLEKFAASHDALSKVFRAKEPQFADVDDVFFSATLETLFEIIKTGTVYESIFQLTNEQFNELIGLLEKPSFKSSNFLDWIRKRRTPKVEIWKDVFQELFQDTPNSQQLITDFKLNRNHVAHNKPISRHAFGIMQKNFADFTEMVEKADARFEAQTPSDEFYLTMEIEEEMSRVAEEQAEFEDNYLRHRLKSEAGIKVLFQDDIVDLLVRKADELYQKIYESYYWDCRFIFGEQLELQAGENEQELFSVRCKACSESYLVIYATLSVDDDMAGESTLCLRCTEYQHGKTDSEIGNAAIRFQNGYGSEDPEDGTLKELVNAELDESEIDAFVQSLKEALESLNPYISKKETLEFLAAKEGGSSPVAHFPCEECGEYGVSLDADFYPFGHCCYCGAENAVHECFRCGSIFGDDEGEGELCNNCWAKVESE